MTYSFQRVHETSPSRNGVTNEKKEDSHISYLLLGILNINHTNESGRRSLKESTTALEVVLGVPHLM